MTDKGKQLLQENKRLLEHMLKQNGANRAEIMMALKAIQEQEDSGVDNATMMKDANGNEIFYFLLKKNPLTRLFLYIKKIVLELLSRLIKFNI